MQTFHIILLAVATVCVLPVFADSPSSGLYEVTAQMESQDMPIPARELTTTICVSGEGFANPQAFMGNQQDGGDCEVIDYEMDEGKMTMTMICRAQGGEMTMNTRGTYTDTSYSTTTEMEM